jgi:hypothetical protein
MALKDTQKFEAFFVEEEINRNKRKKELEIAEKTFDPVKAMSSMVN